VSLRIARLWLKRNGIKPPGIGKEEREAMCLTPRRNSKHPTQKHMQSRIDQSNNTKEIIESSEVTPTALPPKRLARRSFLRNLGMGAALLAPGAALLGGSSKALAATDSQTLTAGDVAILQLLAAAELIEADLWQQYKELGGVDAPDSGYKAGLVILDGDQPSTFPTTPMMS
jgi:hypothetical protein